MKIILNIMWAYGYGHLVCILPLCRLYYIVCMITNRVFLTYQMRYRIKYAYKSVMVTDHYKIVCYGAVESSSMYYR